MKLSSTAITAILAYTALVSAAPTKASTNDLAVKRENTQELMAKINELNALKSKRDNLGVTLSARENALVTEILTYLNDSDIATDLIHYIATSDTLAPIAAEVIVKLLGSGLIKLSTVLSALVDSGVINDVIGDIISDCQIYETLFAMAASLISDLKSKVAELVEEGISDLTSKRDVIPKPVVNAEKRDLYDIAVSLLESAGDSGLATSVVEELFSTDYLPFGEMLLADLLASGVQIDWSSLLSTVKESGLLGSLFKEIFSASTLETVVTTAFAAFKGDCSSDSTSTGVSDAGSILDSLLGDSDSSSTSTATTDCSKRRKRRRRALKAAKASYVI